MKASLRAAARPLPFSPRKGKRKGKLRNVGRRGQETRLPPEVWLEVWLGRSAAAVAAVAFRGPFGPPPGHARTQAGPDYRAKASARWPRPWRKQQEARASCRTGPAAAKNGARASRGHPNHCENGARVSRASANRCAGISRVSKSLSKMGRGYLTPFGVLKI